MVGTSSSGESDEQREPKIDARLPHLLTSEGSRVMMSILEAVACGSVDDVDSALKTGECIDVLNESGEAALMIATRARDVTMVRHLLERGANCRLRNANGDTSLHVACFTGQLKVVEALLSHGALLEGLGEQSNRPIHLACAGGFEDVVACLLLRGCVVNAQNANGALPSTLCAKFERVRAIVSDIERLGEVSRDALRREVAARGATVAIERRNIAREEDERRVREAQEQDAQRAETTRARDAELQRIVAEKDAALAEIAALREKEEERLKVEEAKKAKRAKLAAKKAKVGVGKRT